MYTETGGIILGIGSPHMGNEPVISEHLSAVLSQQRDDLEFILGQMNLSTIPGDEPLLKINDKTVAPIRTVRLAGISLQCLHGEVQYGSWPTVLNCRRVW